MCCHMLVTCHMHPQDGRLLTWILLPSRPCIMILQTERDMRDTDSKANEQTNVLGECSQDSCIVCVMESYLCRILCR